MAWEDGENMNSWPNIISFNTSAYRFLMHISDSSSYAPKQKLSLEIC